MRVNTSGMASFKTTSPSSKSTIQQLNTLDKDPPNDNQPFPWGRFGQPKQGGQPPPQVFDIRSEGNNSPGVMGKPRNPSEPSPEVSWSDSEFYADQKTPKNNDKTETTGKYEDSNNWANFDKATTITTHSNKNVTSQKSKDDDTTLKEETTFKSVDTKQDNDVVFFLNVCFVSKS